MYLEESFLMNMNDVEHRIIYDIIVLGILCSNWKKEGMRSDHEVLSCTA